MTTILVMLIHTHIAHDCLSMSTCYSGFSTHPHSLDRNAHAIDRLQRPRKSRARRFQVASDILNELVTHPLSPPVLPVPYRKAFTVDPRFSHNVRRELLEEGSVGRFRVDVSDLQRVHRHTPTNVENTHRLIPNERLANSMETQIDVSGPLSCGVVRVEHRTHVVNIQRCLNRWVAELQLSEKVPIEVDFLDAPAHGHRFALTRGHRHRFLKPQTVGKSCSIHHEHVTTGASTSINVVPPISVSAS